MNIELVVHNIAYKEQEPCVSQISLVTEGWRNVGDAESTWSSCALGEGGRVSGLRALLRIHAGSASSRRCAPDVINRGIVHATIVRLFSEGHYTFSRRRLAREPRRHPPSLWILNRRHLTVRRGAHHGAHWPPASSVWGLMHKKPAFTRDKHGWLT